MNVCRFKADINIIVLVFVDTVLLETLKLLKALETLRKKVA